LVEYTKQQPSAGATIANEQDTEGTIIDLIDGNVIGKVLECTIEIVGGFNFRVGFFSCYSRQSQTALGMITMTPIQQRLEFRFTMFDGAMNTEMMIFFLTMVRRYYGKQVMIIFDRLSAHISAQKYFKRVQPDWFLFEYLPAYSPELNPVEQCWQHMKNSLCPFSMRNSFYYDRKISSNRP